MATEKQVAANRQNAKSSTGPRTDAGKRRSRRNALRHGLTAETVIGVHEDATAYRALQRAVCADYRPQTNFETELIERLVSLLWRLRRAVAIESGLLNIHAQRRDWKPERNLEILYNLIPSLTPRAGSISIDHSDSNDGTESNRLEIANSRDAIAQAFLRLGRTDERVFERIGRYEMNIWRQTLQTILLLNSITRQVNDDGLKSSPSYLRFKPQKTSQLLRWPPVKPFLYD
jgi:hypothetical protein